MTDLPPVSLTLKPGEIKCATVKETEGPPRPTALEWLLDLASGSVGYPERIQSFINRADWKGLTDWLGTIASPAVVAQFQARGWPPVPKIYHGLMPALTTGDLVRGRPLWKSVPTTLFELEQAAAKQRADADELIPAPEVEI